MRVISRDGMRDYPYECSGFYAAFNLAGDGVKIFADFGSNGGPLMAEYGTSEEAAEAMQAMRQAWFDGCESYQFKGGR